MDRLIRCAPRARARRAARLSDELGQRGHTLLEVMVVVAIMGILMMMAIPVFLNATTRSQSEQALELVERPKERVEDYYYAHGAFPATNDEAGLPEPDQLIGNYVAGVELDDGALHIELGHKIHPDLAGEIVTVRPMVVEGSPASPISWLCGGAEPPEGLRPVGDNRTTAPISRLPVHCR